MKNYYLGIIVLFFCGLSFNSLGQTSQIYVDWTALPEDTNHVDVSYRIIKCTPTSVDQIHLNVFNENDALSAITFTLTISDNANNLTTTHVVTNYTIMFAEMHIADCSTTTYPDLKINLPTGYDPNSTQVFISF